jgi:hypothetical protein
MMLASLVLTGVVATTCTAAVVAAVGFWGVAAEMSFGPEV